MYVICLKVMFEPTNSVKRIWQIDGNAELYYTVFLIGTWHESRQTMTQKLETNRSIERKEANHRVTSRIPTISLSRLFPSEFLGDERARRW